MLTINGRKFAKNNSEMIDSLFQGPVTAHGLYAVKRGRGTRNQGKVAIEIRTPSGEPMALISPDGVLVTAHRDADGKTRYMYGLTKPTRDFLGLPEELSRRDELTITTAALADVILA